MSDDFNTKAEVISYLKRQADMALDDEAEYFHIYYEYDSRGNAEFFFLTYA